MKRLKKNASNFKKLNAAQMKNLKGGQWVEITNPDGSVTNVWV